MQEMIVVLILNLLPVDVKEDLLDFVMKNERFNQIRTSGNKMDNAKTQAPIKLDYKGAKNFRRDMALILQSDNIFQTLNQNKK